MMGMKQFIHSYLSSLTFTYSDVLEIIILSFVVYHILIWIRNTRAWTLMKGILVMIVFIFIATLLNLDSILFLVSKGINAILGNGRYFSAGAEEGSGTAWRKEVPFFADTV